MNSTNVHHFLLNHFPTFLQRKQNPTSEKDVGLETCLLFIYQFIVLDFHIT